MIYRQFSHRLRIQRGTGRPDKVSERPRQGSKERGWGDYLDSDDAPTLIEFDALDQVDVRQLLKTGAIVAYTSPEEARDATT